jgi:DNA gyrase inhibitor GyrI
MPHSGGLWYLFGLIAHLYKPLARPRLIFLLAFVFPILGVLWWWGMLASASIEVLELAPQRYAYLSAQGAYSKLSTKRSEVAEALHQQGYAPRRSLTLIYDDPRTTPTDQRRARTGFVIAADTPIRAPLIADTIPARRALVAKVRAHPLFAYGKAYAALLDYLEQHGKSLRMPTLEFYDGSVLTVEMTLENSP